MKNSTLKKIMIDKISLYESDIEEEFNREIIWESEYWMKLVLEGKQTRRWKQ